MGTPVAKIEPSIAKIEPQEESLNVVSGTQVAQRKGKFMIALESCNLMNDIVSEKALHKNPSFKYVVDRALGVHDLQLATSSRPIVVRSTHEVVQVEHDKKYRLIRYKHLGNASQEENDLVAMYNACAEGLGVRWTHAHAFRFLLRLQLRQKLETPPLELLEMLANHLPEGKQFKLWECQGDSHSEHIVEGKQLNSITRGVKRKGLADNDRHLLEAQNDAALQQISLLHYIILKDEHSRCHEYAVKYSTNKETYNELY
jgi:hypothetical protein